MNITVYMPKDLRDKIKNHKEKLNVSKIVQGALRDYFDEGVDKTASVRRIERLKKYKKKLAKIQEVLNET